MIRIGEIKQTTHSTYSAFNLTRHSIDGYALMVLVKDPETGKNRGWFMGTSGTLKHCRDYERNFFKKVNV